MLNEFHDKIHFVGDRYEVLFPWKNHQQTLPDNFKLSLKRMWGLICHLRQSPEILTEYDLIIQSQLKQGIVELLNSPAEEKNHRVHYLPHHAVIRCSATTMKITVIYGASAKSNDPSLNDCLHTGLKIHQNILDLLIRFRLLLTVLTVDI